MSITLTQDLNSTLDGVNLKWIVTSMNTLKELTLVYYNNTTEATISSKDLDPNVLRYNLVLDFGQSYSFQLQALDISNATVYSNILSLTTPLNLAPPVITEIVGLNNSFNVILASTANTLTTTDTVEFVLKQSNNTIFWVVKNYSASGIYTLTSADNASIANYNTYRIACMFQPVSNASYFSPSNMSNTITATPSDTPNAPTNLVGQSVGTTNLDLQLTWDRPNDFAQYSSDFSIRVGIQQLGGSYVYTNIVANLDVVSYTWVNVTRGYTYKVSVQYINTFGVGEVAETGFITLTSVPDAPILVSAVDGDTQSVLTWQAPAYDGQTPITNYKVFQDNVEIVDLSGNILTYTPTGLTNGVTYTYSVKAVNAVGTSAESNEIESTAFGAMSIVSASVVSKTVTVVINPNGRPVQQVYILAIDGDPDNINDGSFVADITTGISQNTSSNVTVNYSFSSFSSAISFYCVVAQTSNNSAFFKNSIP